TGLEKFDLSAGLTFDPAPRPLGAIVLLETAETCALEPVAQVAAVPLLSSQVFRPHAAVLLGRQAALFAQCAALARTVPVYRLSRPKRFATLDAICDLIETQFAPRP
ncbi:MAG: hypothetical protein B7Z15_06070, partial [Rhizobiales bacterium 32-66-8]